MYLNLTFIYLMLSIAVCTADWLTLSRKCHFGDENCVTDIANKIIENINNRKIQSTGFDPWYEWNVTVNDGPFDLIMELNRNEIRGLSKTVFTKSVGWGKNPATSKFELYGTVPRISYGGFYRAKGIFFQNTIDSRGYFEDTMENCSFSLKIKPKVITKSGKKHIQVDTLKLYVEPKNFRGKITGLFGINTTLMDNFITYINTNWKLLWDELGPYVFALLEESMKPKLSRGLEKYPYEDLFSPNA